MAAISFVTTCKGRLAHLRQTLPIMAAQGAEHEVVVVDFDCPDGTAAWVRDHFPAARVVEAKDEPEFLGARARNLGAAAATRPWLMFVDADVMLQPGFAAYMQAFLDRARLLRPAPVTPSTWGSFLVPRESFLAVEGFDEVMQGWGGEDDDVCHRLRTFGGCELTSFPGELLVALEHGDAARMRFRGAADRWLGHRVNGFYAHIKSDLIRYMYGGRPLSEALRRDIYGQVLATLRADAEAGRRNSRITVHLPNALEMPLAGGRISRKWVFDLEAVAEAPGSIPGYPS